MGQRRSYPRLQEPAPPVETMDEIFAASLRTPDHMHLRPWRFLVIAGDDRHHLGELFVKDALQKDPLVLPEIRDTIRAKAMRAPLIVVGVLSYKTHEKVPFIEQAIATGGVLNNIGMGVYAHGFGSVWRTGPFASSAIIGQGLGVAEDEEIIGYLYIGTPSNANRPQRTVNPNQFFSTWPPRIENSSIAAQTK